MRIKATNGGKYELKTDDRIYEIGPEAIDVPDELARPLVDSPEIAIAAEDGGE